VEISDLTLDAEPHAGLSADIRRACALLGGLSPIASATANLLGTIADDMDDAPAYQRKAFAGTAAEHLQVWDNDGVRIDWTEALELARTIISDQGA
jgi:hypothetical protein